MEIKEIQLEEISQTSQLAQKLWPDATLKELEKEWQEVLQEGKGTIFSSSNAGKLAAFAYCSLRFEYVEGTDSSPVGYLEGIFVDEEHRRKGIAKQLVESCERWAKGKGCREFASDCELGNEESLLMHERLGFREANRIVCFVKNLN